MFADGDVVAGRYRLESLIGEGGMGEVWRAQHLQLGKFVAVKLMRPESLTEDGVKRFFREARLGAAIRHRNVVNVEDYGEHRGVPFLVLEHLHGESLADRIKKPPPLPVEELVEYALGALAGLTAVHAAGIVHRDLKPANIFLAHDADGVVCKLLDFGISRSSVAIEGDPSAVSLTQTHQVLGTPYYMSPEQVRSAKSLDARADIFSMGVILYEATCGRRPFEGPNAAAVIASIMVDSAPPLSSLRPDLPAPLVQVVERAIARDPDARFQSARAMREALSSAALATGTLRSTLIDSGSDLPTQPLSGIPDTLPSARPPLATAAPARRRSWAPALFALLAVVGTASVIAVVHWSEPGTPQVRPTVVEPTPPPPVDAAPALPPIVEAIQIGDVGARDALALSWRDLPSGAVRDALRVARVGESWALVGLEGIDLEEARTFAARIGATTAPVARPTEVLTPMLYRVAFPLNVREAPTTESRLVRDMKAGTLVVALHGTIDGQASSAAEDEWSWVVVDPRHAGWSASNLMERFHGCVPSDERLLGEVPAARREIVKRDLAIAVTRVRERDAVRDGVYVIGRDIEEGRSYVGVLTETSHCEYERVSWHAVSGFVEQAFLVDTNRAGGETLLVMGWRQSLRVPRSGETTWSAFRLPQAAPVWEARLASDEILTTQRRRRTEIRGPALVARVGDTRLSGYWPLEIEYPNGKYDYFMWTGRTLALDPATIVPTTPLGTPN